MPRNIPNYRHPLVGGEPLVYRPHLPAYDPDAPENKPGHPDFEPGTLILGHGMRVGVKAVFQNWNGIPGLDMLYVYCMATGYHTHVTPFDVGLKPLDPDTWETEPYGDDLVVERHAENGLSLYFMGDLDAGKRVLLAEYGEDSITVMGDHKIVVTEHRGSDDPGNYNQWGTGYTEEEAWRYLIGADFGPLGEDYDEAHLRDLLKAHTR